MPTLKQLKTDIQFNRELESLIEVLKGIASSHFRHVQARREYFRRFNHSLSDLFRMVNLLKSKHPFLHQKPSGPDGQQKGDGSPGREPSPKTCVMVITSDEGFLGDLNARVIDAGLSNRKEGDILIVLGERGAHSLEEMQESFLFFPGIPEEIGHEHAYKLRDYIIQQYMRRKFGRVIIVYPKFISFSQQEVSVVQLLPYTLNIAEAGEEQKMTHEILIEPSENSVIDYLIRAWMEQEIYNILWESKLSELASRVIHLEGSSQVISELNKKLRFSYFRTLHRISDKNIREIAASRLIK